MPSFRPWTPERERADRREHGLTARMSRADSRDGLLIGGGALLLVLLGWAAIQVAVEPQQEDAVRDALLQQGIRPVALSRQWFFSRCSKGRAGYAWRSETVTGAACVDMGGRVRIVG